MAVGILTENLLFALFPYTGIFTQIADSVILQNQKFLLEQVERIVVERI